MTPVERCGCLGLVAALGCGGAALAELLATMVQRAASSYTAPASLRDMPKRSHMRDRTPHAGTLRESQGLAAELFLRMRRKIYTWGRSFAESEKGHSPDVPAAKAFKVELRLEMRKEQPQWKRLIKDERR